MSRLARSPHTPTGRGSRPSVTDVPHWVKSIFTLSMNSAAGSEKRGADRSPDRGGWPGPVLSFGDG